MIITKHTISIYLLVFIILLAGFFSKIVPLNLTIPLILIFVLFNINKKPPMKWIYIIFISFSLLFLITPFYSEVISFKRFYSEVTINIFEPIPTFFRILGYLLFSYAISLFYFEKKDFKLIYLSLIVTALFISFFNIYEYYTGKNIFISYKAYDIIMSGTLRVRGPFGDPNASAGMILPGLTILISSFVFYKKVFIIRVILVMFMIYGLYTTSSRTVLLALLSVVVLFLFLNRNTFSLKKKLIFSSIIAILGFYLVTVYLQGRTIELSGSGIDHSSMARVLLFEYALEYLEKYPFFGNGYAYGFHNLFTDFAVSGGIVLLILFLLLLFNVIKNLFLQINDYNAYIALSMLISFLIVGLGISWSNNVIFWFILGLSMNVNILNKGSKC
jgi:O-antigen ligase